VFGAQGDSSSAGELCLNIGERHVAVSDGDRGGEAAQVAVSDGDRGGESAAIWVEGSGAGKRAEHGTPPDEQLSIMPA